MKDEFGKYYEAVEPGRRERAYAWATAIGLQDVDGLKPSKYLIKTAKRNIEGEISAAEARKLVDEYYETKVDHDVPADAEEADKVAARINQIINAPSFTLSPEYYIGLHGKIFEGVFAHAGKIRDTDLTKREWVLNGDTVLYGASFLIASNLEGEFGRETRFKYKGLGEDAFIERFAMFISNLWQIHPFREGNTRTTAVFAIKYLRSKGYEVTNDLFKDKSFYFRNALVRANYENQRLNVVKTRLPLEEFFKVLLFGYDLELKNRFLRIGCEYGSPAAKGMSGLHRENVVINTADDVINVVKDVVKENPLSEAEENAAKTILRCPKTTAAELATLLKVTPRQAQRVIASLKVKAGLKRRGGRKNGEWYFSQSEP